MLQTNQSLLLEETSIALSVDNLLLYLINDPTDLLWLAGQFEKKTEATRLDLRHNL